MVTDTATDGDHLVGHNKAFDQVRACSDGARSWHKGNLK